MIVMLLIYIIDMTATQLSIILVSFSFFLISLTKDQYDVIDACMYQLIIQHA